jgi:hypothetical protein
VKLLRDLRDGIKEDPAAFFAVFAIGVLIGWFIVCPLVGLR